MLYRVQKEELHFHLWTESQNITLSFGDLGLLMTSFFLIIEAIAREEVVYLLCTARDSVIIFRKKSLRSVPLACSSLVAVSINTLTTHIFQGVNVLYLWELR